ncbi:SLP adapter and CSK-interacting membrane protein [Phocoena phocoena]|uniref:SLP adapter and CSK-interacting membrane protein n=1 Tax=Phocoena phocoena TaxID=9742 RepID=UPI003306D5D2
MAISGADNSEVARTPDPHLPQYPEEFNSLHPVPTSKLHSLPSQDPTAMDWWRDNFWIILAVAIIFVCVGLSIFLFCVCKKCEIAKPLKQKQRDEETMYENVTNQFSVQLPPLPPRGVLSPEVASPQETPSRPPAAYSSVPKVRNKKTMAVPSYIEPDDDYDDVDNPAHMENHHLETTASSF